jgi:autotransporter translocation and assembly factor TamB
VRVIRTLLASLAWIVVGLAALLVSAYVHLGTDVADRVVRHYALDAVNTSVRGHIQVGGIETLTVRRLVLRDVTIVDPQGREVAHAEHLSARVRLRPLLRGTIHVDAVRLRDGYVRLLETPDGELSLAQAFDSVDPGPDTGLPGPTVLVPDIEVEGVDVSTDMAPLGLEAVAVRGGLRVEGDALTLRVLQTQAGITWEGARVGRMAELTGVLRTGPGAPSTVELVLRSGEDRVTLAGEAVIEPDDADVEGPALDATVHLDPLSPATLRRAGLDEVAALLRTDLRGSIRVQGTLDDLGAKADLRTAGGPATLEAQLTDMRSLDATFRTPGLELGAILADPPVERVSGDVRIEMDPLAESPRRVTLRATELRADTYRVPSLEVRAELHDEHLVIHELRLPYLAGTLDARGRVGFDGQVDLDVRARIANLRSEPNLRDLVPNLAGGLRGTAKVAYQPGPTPSLRTDADLVATDLRVDDLRVRHLSVVGRTRGAPDRPRVNVAVRGRDMRMGEVEVNAVALTAVGGPERYDVKLHVDAPGQRSLEFDGDVWTTRRGYALQARVLVLGVGDHTWQGKFRRVHFVPDEEVVIEEFVLANGLERLEVAGRYRFGRRPRVEAELTLRHLDLEILDALAEMGPLPVRGRLDLDAQVSGAPTHPTMQLRGSLSGGHVLEVPVDAATFDARWEPEDGTVEAHLQAALGDALGALAVSVEGQHAPGADEPVDAALEGTYAVELSLADLDVALVERVAPDTAPPMAGKLSGSLLADGTLEDFSLAASVTGRHLTTTGVGPLDVALDATFDDATFRARVEARDDVGDLARLSGALSVDLAALVREPDRAAERLGSAPWELHARVPPRPLDQLPVPLPEALAMPAVGSLELDVLRPERGPVEADLKADLRLPHEQTPRELIDGTCADGTRARVFVGARLRDGETRVRLRGFASGERILTGSASAATPVALWLEQGLPEAPPTMRFETELDAPDLARVPTVCRFATGPLSAELTVEDLFGDAPSARLAARSPKITVMDSPELPLRLKAEAGTREATLELRAGDPRTQQRSRVSARVPIAWGGADMVPAYRDDEPLRAVLEMNMTDLGPWLAPVPGIGYPTGRINGRVVAEGVGEDIRFDGALDIHDAGVSFLAAGNRLDGMQGRVAFDGQTIRLERFEARDDGGRIEAKGQLVMKGLRPETAYVEMEARRFPLRTAGRTMGRLTVDARVGMDLGKDEGRVEARLDAMTVNLDALELPQLQSLDPHPEVHLVGPGAKRHGPIVLDETLGDETHVLTIEIKTPTPFWVRRPDMAAQLEADLEVRIAENTTISGRVEIVRGFFELVGRRFVLRRGSVQFTGAEQINPLVEITATHDLGGGRLLTMTMSGDLREPKLRFATEDREIPTVGEAVALLLGPRGADGNTQGNVESQAASVLSGITAGILTTTLRRELGDLFPVITIDSGGTSGVGAIRAGISADRIIPKFLEGVVQSAYVEGFVSTADRSVGEQQGSTSRAGVLVEFRYPYNLTSTVQVAPPQNWSLDLMWDP